MSDQRADKRMSMHDAVAAYVRDGMSLAIEGFTAFICFAAAHEVIRQGRRDLTLVRLTPDVIYDQMVAAGCARRLVFSYLGNPGVGSLHCIRRAVEAQIPDRLGSPTCAATWPVSPWRPTSSSSTSLGSTAPAPSGSPCPSAIPHWSRVPPR